MNKKILRKKFKKTIKSFIKDEDGFVNKDQILKIGLGTIGCLSMLSSLSNVYAGTITANPCSATVHANFDNTAHQNGLDCTAVGTCYRCVMHNNASATTHVDHSAVTNIKVSGVGTLSGKGSADLNIHCPPSYR